MMRATDESLWHLQTRDDDGSNKALPQTSNVSSDKKRDNGGQEVARENVTEKRRQWQLAMADKNL